MTLSELLEELKGIDPETYEALRNYPIYCCSDDEDITVNLLASRNHVLIADALQGCIQQACEGRGWEIEQNYRIRGRDGDLPKNTRHYAVVTSWDNDVHTYRGIGSTGASALLAAYIAAVKKEAKR